MNFTRISCELCRSRFIAEARRFANERDAICAAEGEGVVGFNAITLGATFHISG